MNPRKIALCAGPLLVGLVLAVGFLSRKSQVPQPSKPSVKVRVQSKSLQPPTPSPQLFAAPRPRVEAPVPTVQARGIDEVRVRQHYESFRIALGSGQPAMAESMLSILKPDREVALRYAQDDLARASSSFDRDIARNAVELLRR